ncbi:MAG: hypothetical protein M3492_07760 [Actinomycetota bacterium]|jgi:hypothetical protein|nr:hypothetical protein [Actinomycetota bacterium]
MSTVSFSGATGQLAADEDIGKAGPVGLFLILSLLIVVFFLGRSMRTHLRRVPLEFPDQRSAAARGPDPAARDDQVLEGEIMDPPSRRPGLTRRTEDEPPRLDTPPPDRV